MAKVIKSSHPIKHYADGGLVKKLFSPLVSPSKESDAAGAEFNKELAKKREEAQAAEGKRLEAMPAPVKKQKPYTNPDGTPFTRDQMRKHLGR